MTGAIPPGPVFLSIHPGLGMEGGVGTGRGVSAGLILNRGLSEASLSKSHNRWALEGGQQTASRLAGTEGRCPSAEDAGLLAERADQGPDRGPQETFSFCYSQAVFLEEDLRTLLPSWLLDGLPPSGQASQAPDGKQGPGIARAEVRKQGGLGWAPPLGTRSSSLVSPSGR